MKYAVTFFILAATLLFYAWQAEAWWSCGLLTWAGIAFALVGLAYALNSAVIFGKRTDGTMHVLRTVILIPYCVLAQIIWWFNTRLSSEAPWHRIDDRLIVGRRLGRGEELPPEVTAILDLTSEFTEPTHVRRASGYRCLPMLDASHADPAVIMSVVRDLSERTGTLYIHCAQGHGRTGLLAALILIARNPTLTTEETIAQLRAIRPGIGLSKRQYRALAEIAQRLKETRIVS